MIPRALAPEGVAEGAEAFRPPKTGAKICGFSHGPFVYSDFGRPFFSRFAKKIGYRKSIRRTP
jgi:hypothetical protein